ncbi:DedA family protein [Kitasatospora sp. NPDC057541]|uniref:DedA family protein n=1 Tax=unclassified Kitasatospora TaxID=2633591 RepID=UPI0036C75155
MNVLTDALGHLSPIAVYAVVALTVCAESVLVLGAFAPTLALLLTAGALARAGDVSLPLVITAAAVAAFAGDCLAHRTGRVMGERLRAGRLGGRLPAVAWQHAERLMTRHGGRAVFLGRFLPVVRTLTPHLAGATGLSYRSIAPYSACAAGLWAVAEAGTGYAAATSLQRLLSVGGPVLAVVAVLVVTGAVLWVRKRY